MTFRVAAVQMPHGPRLDANLEVAARHIGAARDADIKLVLLPEYFAATEGGRPADHAAHAKEVDDFLARQSAQSGVAIAANLIEATDAGVFNVGVVYESGRRIASQQKVHPMPSEESSGIASGAAFEAFDLRGVPTGMLVCADVLYPEASRVLSLKGARILLNPVMSAYREVDPTKDAREALYIARAYDAGAFVIKAGGYRRPGGASPPIAGRSLITAPWGILAHYRDDFEEELLVADLDLDVLETFREGQSRFPSRRPGAYGDLV